MPRDSFATPLNRRTVSPTVAVICNHDAKQHCSPVSVDLLNFGTTYSETSPSGGHLPIMWHATAHSRRQVPTRTHPELPWKPLIAIADDDPAFANYLKTFL